MFIFIYFFLEKFFNEFLLLVIISDCNFFTVLEGYVMLINLNL